MKIRTHKGKRAFRRTAAIFLALSTLCSMLAANAAGGADTRVAVESVEADAGDTVTVYVNISGNTGISNFDFVVTYDGSLQLESVTNKDCLCSSGLFVSNPAYGYIIWASARDVTDAEGNLFALTFAVDENAKSGDYNISLSLKNGGAFGGESGNVPVDFIDGKITVGGAPSDTTEDGTTGDNTTGDNTTGGGTTGDNTAGGSTTGGDTTSGGISGGDAQSGSVNTGNGQEETPSNGNGTTGTGSQGTNAPAAPVAVTFTDVAEGAWYYNCVQEMAAAGVIGGYTDHTFRPLNNVACVEVLKLILLASGYDLENSSTGYWAENYYNFALTTGLVGSDVELNEPIARIDIAHILADANGIQGDNSPSPFDDIDDPVITALYNIGLFEGCGNGLFKPNSMLTRAEMAMIVWRLYGYVRTGTVPG